MRNHLSHTHKRILSFLIVFSFCFSAQAQHPYITKWKTDNDGISGANQILLDAAGEFSYTWEEEGNTLNAGSGSGAGPTTITFPQSGTYKLSITPAGSTPFHKSVFTSNTSTSASDSRKLLEVIQWGEVVWGTFQNMFAGAENLRITATDIPDISQVKNMGGAFYGTTLKDIPHLNEWDMSGVTSMFGMFMDASNFNQDLSDWNVGNVRSFRQMFSGAYRFNQDISMWDVSKATEMVLMFSQAESFDQNLGNWNLENLQTATEIFSRSSMSCTNYSKTLQGWAANSRTAANVSIKLSTGGPNRLPLVYSAAAASSRDYLINNLHWTFEGDEEGDCSVTTPAPYITIWQTDNEGITGQNQISFLAVGAFTYEWKNEDNAVDTGSGISHTGETILTFPQPGKYRLNIFPKSNHPLIYILLEPLTALPSDPTPAN